ncbi:MAG: VWA domain-containing protein, partial [Phycisphaerae bacterium]
LFASIGVAYRIPFGEPAPMADVFLNLGTTIELEDYERPPLNLALVIDRSGSMNYTWDDPYGYNYNYSYTPTFFDFLFAPWTFFAPPPAPEIPDDAATKLKTVKAGLNALVDQLRPDDILTVISFNEELKTELAPTFVRDRQIARDAIGNITAVGATNIYDALTKAFELVEEQKTGVNRVNRVVLLTDAQPNVGPDGSPEFVSLVRRYANRDIGLTLMGVGYDFGDDLGREISALRGGNSFFLSDDERARTLFRDEFEFFAVPAAFDLTLDVEVAEGVGIRNVYGVSDYTPGQATARIRIPTLFFSARESGGAIVVRLTATEIPELVEDTEFGSAKLRYTLADGAQRTQEWSLVLPAGTSPEADPPYFSEAGMRRAAVLLDVALVLREAVDLAYDYNGDLAEDMIDAFLEYYDTATLGLSDRIDTTSRSLSDERRLLEEFRGIAQYYR